MATNTLSATFGLTTEINLDNIEEILNAISTTVSVGDENWGAVSVSFDDGSSNQQANECYAEQISLAATTGQNIDLKNFVNILGQAASLFTAVKQVVVSIVSADGSKKVRVGPLNEADAAQLWFGGVAATDYAEVFDTLAQVNSWGGWAVGASTKILRIYNPTGVLVVANVLVLGVK